MAERNWQALLGYLNFSEGRPDPRFAQQLNEACEDAALVEGSAPLRALAFLLRQELERLKAAGSSAFQNATQVEAVLPLTLEHLLPAYREFHADLLAHLGDSDFFQPFFLARAFEAVLAQ